MMRFRFAAVLLMGIVLGACGTQPSTATITGHQWETTQFVMAYGTVERSARDESDLPANVIEREYVVETSDVARRDAQCQRLFGMTEDRYTCTSVRYTVPGWTFDNEQTLFAEGNERTGNRPLPILHLDACPTELLEAGCEQWGHANERFRLDLESDRGTLFSCSVSYSQWIEWPVGTVVTGEDRPLNCRTLRVYTP